MRTLALLLLALAVLACSGGSKITVDDIPMETDAAYLELGGKRVARYEREATGDFASLGTEIYYAYYTEGGAEVLHGPVTGFYPNGQHSYQGRYIEGNREGRYLFWNDEGIKTGEAQFEAGEYHGTYTEWSPEGLKKRERTFKRGKLDGPTTWWDKGGKPFVGFYVDGRPMDGIFVELLDTGERKILQYRDGQPMANLEPPRDWWW